MSSHSCDALQGRLERPKSLASIIAGQNTQIVLHAVDEFDQAPHCTLIHVHMHVANVEYSEAVKKRWQLLEYNVIALDENAFCIPASAPIKPGQLQCVSNDRMDRIPILYVKGDEALAEILRLVVRLDAQSLSRAERSETFLQFAQDIFVHGITSSEIGSTFHGEHEALLDTTEYSLPANACFTERHGSFARRELPAGGKNHLPRTPMRERAATVPALSAHAFPAHPTRFERVTFAFRALLVTPPQPLQGRCRRTANRLNEPHAPVAQLDRVNAFIVSLG